MGIGDIFDVVGTMVDIREISETKSKQPLKSLKKQTTWHLKNSVKDLKTGPKPKSKKK